MDMIIMIIMQSAGVMYRSVLYFALFKYTHTINYLVVH